MTDESTHSHFFESPLNFSAIESFGWKTLLVLVSAVFSLLFLESAEAQTLADLTYQSVSVSPTSVAQGGSVTVRYTIKNQGGTAAPATTTRIQIKNASNVPLNQWDFSSPSLGAGLSIDETRTLSVGTPPPGTYVIYVILDAKERVAQSNLKNDYSPGTQFTVQGVTTTTTTNTTSPPDSPQPLSPGLAQSPGSEITTLRPTFRWNPVTGATHYTINISVDIGGMRTLIFEGSEDGAWVENKTSYQLPPGFSLEWGKRYAWDVDAKDSNGRISSPSRKDFFFSTKAVETSEGNAGTTNVPAMQITDIDYPIMSSLQTIPLRVIGTGFASGCTISLVNPQGSKMPDLPGTLVNSSTLSTPLKYSLSEGDWLVKVTAPSGAVSQSYRHHVTYPYPSLDFGYMPPIRTDKVILMIHGWNPGYDKNPYGSQGWEALAGALQGALPTSWSMVPYNWYSDAMSGTKIVAIIDGITDANYGGVASIAATKGYYHGQYLAKELAEKYPNLQAVHIIAHSAGAWAAYSLVKQYNPKNKVTVQITLLDPFMPTESGASSENNPLPLGKTQMSALRPLSGNVVLYKESKLENYYVIDNTDEIGIGATSQIFNSGIFTNVNLSEYHGFSAKKTYRGHDSPIRFYADSISGLYEEEPRDILAGQGWVRSMAYAEKKSGAIASTGTTTATTNTTSGTGTTLAPPPDSYLARHNLDRRPDGKHPDADVYLVGDQRSFGLRPLHQ